MATRIFMCYFSLQPQQPYARIKSGKSSLYRAFQNANTRVCPIRRHRERRANENPPLPESPSGQRIAAIGVKSGRHRHEVRLEFFQLFKRAGEHCTIVGARRARRDGLVKAIAATIGAASSGVRRELMYGEKSAIILVH